jgi:hypothetical protein
MEVGNSRQVPLGGWTVSRPVFKRLEQTTEPSGTVVDLATLKTHLRVTHASEDSYITTLIGTATDAAERYMNRKLLPRTMKMWMDYLPGNGTDYWQNGVTGAVQAPIYYANTSAFRFFELIGTPVTDVSEVGYINDAGTVTVVDDSQYIADFTDPDMPARIILQRGASWPTDLQIAHSIYVEYTLGYDSASVIPASIKHGVMVMAAALWSNRGDNLDQPMDVMQFPAVRALYNPYRVRSISTI